VIGALKECGLDIPEDEDAKVTYVEYDGDLFWVNVNRRGELWVNTKEKSRPVFRTVPAARVEPEEGAKAPRPGARGKSESTGTRGRGPRRTPARKPSRFPWAPRFLTGSVRICARTAANRVVRAA